MKRFEFTPIGVIRSCFKEKFGVPRQPGLVPEAEAILQLVPPYDRREAIRGLEGFSHIWVLFVFHRVAPTKWKTMVRPPRLGGNRKVGVFASRSPFRPNPIGLSAVALKGIECRGKAIKLRLGGIDLVDGTPVLDIKPYLRYADSLTDARGGFAEAEPQLALEVVFDAQPQHYLDTLKPPERQRMTRLIQQLLQQDPRPAYLESVPDERCFGMRLDELNVRWQVQGTHLRVTSIDRSTS